VPSSLRPYLAWDEYAVQQLTDPGDLVCDPFMRAETCIAALEFGRRFVGASLDVGVVADTRRRIGAVR
jgi:DNA modification methylase